MAALIAAASLYAMYGMVVNIRLAGQLSQLHTEIAIEQGKTRKQQAEYDQYQVELPKAKAELETLAPVAAEATEYIDALKQDRKTLRKQIESDTAALAAVVPVDNGPLEEREAQLVEYIAQLQKELDAIESAKP